MPGNALTKNRLGGLIILAFCLGYAWQIFAIPTVGGQTGATLKPSTMPTFLCVLGTLFSLLLIFNPERSDAARGSYEKLRWGRLLMFLALMSAYGLALRPLGFLLATIGFLASGFVMLGERRITLIVGVATLLTASFWMLMSLGLGVFLPPLPQMFGNL